MSTYRTIIQGWRDRDVVECGWESVGRFLSGDRVFLVRVFDRYLLLAATASVGVCWWPAKANTARSGTRLFSENGGSGYSCGEAYDSPVRRVCFDLRDGCFGTPDGCFVPPDVCFGPPVAGASACQSRVLRPASRGCFGPPAAGASDRQSRVLRPASCGCFGPPVAGAWARQSRVLRPASRGCFGPPVAGASAWQSRVLRPASQGFFGAASAQPGVVSETDVSSYQ